MSELAGFASVKIGTNLNEWLNEVAFVTSEKSDPMEPQTLQQVWWHLDLTAREKWREGIKLSSRKCSPCTYGETWNQQAFQKEGG